MISIDELSTDSEKLKFACNLLTGKALTWLRYQQTFGTSFQSFIAFCHAIYDEFVDVDHVNKLRDEFDVIVLAKHQTVPKYTQRFRELLLELGPHAPDEAAALHRFIRGLHGEIRLYTSM